MVLRDSLGGNCQTAMIATVSMDRRNLLESLSTGRFSQRVSSIKNIAMKNEAVDDKLMLKRLRKRIAELEVELALLKAEQGHEVDASVMDAKLTESDRRDCAVIVRSYLGGEVKDPIQAGIGTPLRFRECMRLFKAMVKSRQASFHEADRRRVSISPFVSDPCIQKVPVTESEYDERMAQLLENPGGCCKQSKSSSRHTSDTCRAYVQSAYKTPFERKREKTIKMLTNRVRKKRIEQQAENDALQQLKAAIRFHQKTALHTNLIEKANQNKRQLTEQRARLKSLNMGSEDRALYEQERTIESALLKKQLDLMSSMDESMQPIPKVPVASSVTRRTAIKAEEVVPKVSRPAVNTRQVLDKLQEESRTQERIQKRIDKEHLLVLSKQIEVKEDATRKKLRDLKLKLLKDPSRKTSTDSNRHSSVSTNHEGTTPTQTAPPGRYLDIEDNTAELSNLNNEPFSISFNLKPALKRKLSMWQRSQQISPRCSTAIIKVPTSPRSPTSTKRSHSKCLSPFISHYIVSPRQTSAKKRQTQIAQPTRTHSAPVPDGSTQKYQLPKKNVDEVWRRSYSASTRTGTVHTPKKEEFDEHLLVPKKAFFGDLLCPSPQIAVCPIRDPEYEDLPFKLEKNFDSDDDDDEDKCIETANILLNLIEPEKLVKDIPIVKPPHTFRSLEDTAYMCVQFNPQNKKPTKSNRVESKSPDNRSKNKSFEATLHSFLAADGAEGQLTIKQADYDSFARSPKVDSFSIDRNHSVPRQAPRAKQPPSLRKSRPSQTWGPEAKNLSIRERLAEILNKDTLPEATNISCVNSNDINTVADQKRNTQGDINVTNSLLKLKIKKSSSSDILLDMPNKDIRKKSSISPNIINATTDQKRNSKLEFTLPRAKSLSSPKKEIGSLAAAHEQRERVMQIRRAHSAAGVIQQAWRHFKERQGFGLRRHSHSVT